MSEHKERKTLEERQQMSDLERLRHSCAHVLATAICRLWPDAQLAGGPAVDNGFYYDVELDHRISTEDFERIEEEMKKVVKENQVFQKEVISRADAMKMAESGELGALGPRSEPSRFKIDLLNDIPEDEEISLYRNGDFTDLCAGPHVGRTGNCKAFKIMSVASAFYKGDKNRPMLQRIYGTCFPNRTQLDEHLERLEEARRRDHRKLGRELGLFCIDESVGQGLILWKPKGALIRRSLQDFITEELDKLGYSQVYTPNIGKLDLYRTSGHFPYYQESQYAPIPERDAMEKLSQEGASCAELFNGLATGTIEGYMLKPMNCPHHCEIFKSSPRSYRELPLRLAEFGTVYRYEQTGELHGLTRVRGFTQDDAHIFCAPEQIKDEFLKVMDIILYIFNALHFDNYEAQISLRDPNNKDKYIGSDENWHLAENAIIEACEEKGLKARKELGEAAFYGPKLDFMVKDAIGRRWQLGTIQVDYNLPERFQLEYTGADNQKHRPVMIHRAPFGSLERFVAVLLEHTAGKFPLWLSPEQAIILPISEKFNDYAREVARQLNEADVRVTVDDRNEKIGRKIRDNELKRVPYMLVVGEKEAANGEVSVRKQGEGDKGTMKVAEFADEINRLVKELQ